MLIVLAVMITMMTMMIPTSMLTMTTAISNYDDDSLFYMCQQVITTVREQPNATLPLVRRTHWCRWHWMELGYLLTS